MDPIPVKPHPFRQTFDSFQDAISHAMSHPLRPRAEADAAQLRGAALSDAYWSAADFVLAFSSSKWLHILVAADEVRWRVLDSEPVLRAEPQFRVGAPPIELDWGADLGVHVMDASALVAKRIGSELTNLFVNHSGFFAYFRGHLVFQLHSIYRTDTGEDMLYVVEDD